MTNPKSKDGEMDDAPTIEDLAAILGHQIYAAKLTHEEAWNRTEKKAFEQALRAAYEQGAKDMRERAAKEARKRREVKQSGSEFDRGWWSAATCIEDEINLLPTQPEDARG